MASHIERRKFLATLGGAAATRPLAARAQQPVMPVVGFLDSRPPDAMSDRLRAFRQGLKAIGYVDGENVEILHHFADNQIDRLPMLAADVVRRPDHHCGYHPKPIVIGQSLQLNTGVDP